MKHNLYNRWALVALLLALLATTNSVSAHAKVASSTPAADSTVATAPASVTVVFDNHDALKAEGSLLQVTDATGAGVDLGDSVLDRSDADRKTLVVSLKPNLGAGVYTVNWTAVSSGDNSVAEGSFRFTVGGTTAAPASQAPPATLPRTGGEDGMAGTLLLSGVLFATGMLIRRRLGR